MRLTLLFFNELASWFILAASALQLTHYAQAARHWWFHGLTTNPTTHYGSSAWGLHAQLAETGIQGHGPPESSTRYWASPDIGKVVAILRIMYSLKMASRRR